MKIFANNFGLVLATQSNNPHFHFQSSSWDQVEKQLTERGVLFPWQTFYVQVPIGNDWLESIYQFHIRPETSDLKAEVVLMFSGESEMEEFRTQYFAKFRQVGAAGGLVINEHQEMLLIHRRGMWDLPKGKLEPGESVEENALREVEEETGITGPKLGKLLPPTYHIYPQKGWILKTTHWFLMEVAGAGPLVPQVEEEIHAAEWVKVDGIMDNLPENTFPTIRETIRHAVAELH